MDHPALRAIVRELLRVIEQHPLAILNEGFLKIIAAEAALYTGALLLEGSNNGGKRNRLQIQSDKLSAILVSDSTSRIGQNEAVGKPKDTTTSDLRLLLPYVTQHPGLQGSVPLFEVEMKARCSFGSTSKNSSVDLLKDFKRLVSGKVDAFCLATDAELYNGMRNPSNGRGRKREFANQDFFSGVFPTWNCETATPISHCYSLRATTGLGPSPEDLVTALGERKSLDIHSITHIVKSQHGDRILSIFSRSKPEWAVAT